MRLETERLVIRSDTAGDADAVAALWSDAEVMRYMWGPRDPEKVRAAVLEAAARHEAGEEADEFTIWTVADRATGAFLGDAGFTRKEIAGRDQLELTYLVAREHWGKGIATEAAAALRDWAYGEKGLDRFVALVHPDNAASCRVAEKIGMEDDGLVERPKGPMRLYVATRR